MMRLEDPILVADLIGYVRLTEAVPSFVLPVFEAVGEQGAIMVVQRIEDGVIKDFVLFDPELSTIHRAETQDQFARSGDVPLLGYETAEGMAIIQSRQTLRRHLRAFVRSSDLADKPFSRRELARFCGDEVAEREAEVASVYLLRDGAPTSAGYLRLSIIRMKVREALSEIYPQIDFGQIRIGREDSKKISHGDLMSPWKEVSRMM